MITIKAIAMTNPNLPLISTALFHSTPILSMKKRYYWPQRSDSRGPPRLFKTVFRKPKSSGFIGNCYDRANVTSGNCRANGEKTQDSSSKHSRKESSNSSNLISPETIYNRRALGLNATGPLTLDQVKMAYRQHAMKWHPDHHQGGVDKALAEAHFKKINAAHESLCNELYEP